MFHSSLRETGIVVDTVDRHCYFSIFNSLFYLAPMDCATHQARPWISQAKNIDRVAKLCHQGNPDLGIKPHLALQASPLPQSHRDNKLGRKLICLPASSINVLKLQRLCGFAVMCPHPAIYLFWSCVYQLDRHVYRFDCNGLQDCSLNTAPSQRSILNCRSLREGKKQEGPLDTLPISP